MCRLSSLFSWPCKCSFFSWFTETQQKDDIDEIQDEVRSLCVSKIYKDFEAIYFISTNILKLLMDRYEIIFAQIAEIIKEDLWPNPLTYFNNVSYFPW